jgi:hypothetical protein
MDRGSLGGWYEHDQLSTSRTHPPAVPGFDPEGAEQLKKLVGTREWIGTSGLDI